MTTGKSWNFTLDGNEIVNSDISPNRILVDSDEIEPIRVDSLILDDSFDVPFIFTEATES